MAKERGATFLGGSKSLNTIGRSVYAYSGTYQSLGSVTTMLNFTTPNKPIIGSFIMNCAIDYSTGNINTGVVTGYRLSLNDIVVAMVKVEGSTEDAPSYATEEFLIPPLTSVKLERIASANNSSFLDTAHFVGKIDA